MLSRGVAMVLRTTRTYSSESQFTAYKTLKTDKVFRVTIDPEEYFKIKKELDDLKWQQNIASHKAKLDDLDVVTETLIKWYRESINEKVSPRKKVATCLNAKLVRLYFDKEDRKSRLEQCGYNEFNAYDQFSKDLHEITAKIIDVKNMIKDLE